MSKGVNQVSFAFVFLNLAWLMTSGSNLASVRITPATLIWNSISGRLHVPFHSSNSYKASFFYRCFDSLTMAMSRRVDVGSGLSNFYLFFLSGRVSFKDILVSGGIKGEVLANSSSLIVERCRASTLYY